MIAPRQLPRDEELDFMWCGASVNTLVLNIVTSTIKDIAIKDFKGLYNTSQIIQQLQNQNSAAKYCTNYVFPNGNNGYLGAAGEWFLVKNNLIEVNNCLSLTPNSIPINNWEESWSSTQADANSS